MFHVNKKNMIISTTCPTLRRKTPEQRYLPVLLTYFEHIKAVAPKSNIIDFKKTNISSEEGLYDW